MSITSKPCFLAFLALLAAAAPASAQEPAPKRALSGVPIVLDASTLIVHGERIALWGLETLASDQQCWQLDTPWSCGEQAIMTLRHMVTGRSISCDIEQEALEGSLALAKCYRQKGPHKIDLSAYMIIQGLAMDRSDVSGGAYFDEENDAQIEKRGIWSGRFQTAKDWREGIQRFVGEDENLDQEMGIDKNLVQDEDEAGDGE